MIWQKNTHTQTQEEKNIEINNYKFRFFKLIKQRIKANRKQINK